MNRGLLSCMLAVAGLFGTATPASRAQGVIVTTLPEPIGVWSDLFLTLDPIDVNGDNVVDFTFGASAGSASLRTERTNQLIYRIAPPTLVDRWGDWRKGFKLDHPLISNWPGVRLTLLAGM